MMPETPETLLTRLAESPDHPYPEPIIREMIRRQDEMIPALLAVLEDAETRPAHYLEGGNWKSLTFAAYLLAQFREKRAFKPLCATLNHPAKVTDTLWGDSITEDMGRLLASVYDGDDAPLRKILTNHEAHEYVTGGSIPDAYLCLVAAGVISCEYVQSVATAALTELLPREASFAWDGWTALCADLGLADLVPLVESAIEDDLLDPTYYGFDELLQQAESGQVDLQGERRTLIEDTIEETSWWYTWSKPEEPKSIKPRPLPLAPVVAQPRTGPKIGRNDPCPCGSGKKYKKCCGTADELQWLTL